MPGNSGRRVASATEFEESHDADVPVFSATLSAMERGGEDCESEWQQQQQEPTPRVAVAATEAHAEEDEERRALERYYRCMAKTFSIALLGLAVGFTGVFVYVWVNALTKVRYCRWALRS